MDIATTNITLVSNTTSNDLYAYVSNDGVCIQVFEFDCTLNNEQVIALRDFLNTVIKK